MFNKKDKPGTNIYDRIFRENAPKLFLPIIEQRLGLKIQSYEPLPGDLPRTFDREVDFLYKITTVENKEEILHIEFQRTGEREMIYRVGEYDGIIKRKYKLPIRHVVVYLGKGKSRMPSTLKEDEVYRGFDLINVSTLNTEDLLSSQVPEVVLMALLSKFNKDQTERILKLIVNRLKQISKTGKVSNKYLNQIIILSRLHNKENLVTKLLTAMPITYDVENDYLYKQGLERGLEQGIEQGVKVKEEQAIIGMKKVGMENVQISEALSISIKRVEKVLAKWKQEGKP